MRALFATAPAWVVAAVLGAIYAVWMTVWSTLTDHTSWDRALRGVAVGIVIYVPAMWLVERRRRARLTDVIGDVTPEQRLAIGRAAGSGNPPADAALLPAAIALSYQGLDEYYGNRAFTRLLYGFLILLTAVFAVTESRWYAFFAVLWIVAGIRHLQWPRKAYERVARLEAARSAG